MIDLRLGDNLQILRDLKAEGKRFDLVELDGPYMAGLEDWDCLSEDMYIRHYAERLSLVRDLLHPWGVVFVFGYPEGCAEIKSWCRRSDTLHLRRWLTWYKQRTLHKGRKVENILLFTRQRPSPKRLEQFGEMLKYERSRRGWTLEEVGKRGGYPWWHRGGNLYYETGSGGFVPSADELITLSNVFGFNHYPWWEVVDPIYKGITDIDYMNQTYPEDTTDLNGNGLRSKPVQLYLDLFKPTVPPTNDKQALILYGGSGNAGIAAASLGYDVTVCELDPKRCDFIRNRWDKQVRKWTEKAQAVQVSLSIPQVEQPELFGGKP